MIVECKVGSKTDYGQMAKYISYAEKQHAPTVKALILLSRESESYPDGIEDLAASKGVTLRRRRWHEDERPGFR